MNFEIFFEENESVIRTAIRSVCKKMFHTNTECEECEGKLLLEIVEKDFLILRSFRGGDNSKLGAYLFSALYRKVIDRKRKEEGQYRPSKKAMVLGKCAIELEKRLFFGSDLHEAHQKMLDIVECEDISIDDARKIENEIRRKTGKEKTKTEYISDVNNLYGQNKEESQLETKGKPEKYFLVNGIHSKDPLSYFENKEANKIEQYQNIISNFLEKMSEEDRLIFNMHFFKSINISQIARSIDREGYYVKTKIENLLADLKGLMIGNNLSLEDLTEKYNY